MINEDVLEPVGLSVDQRAKALGTTAPPQRDRARKRGIRQSSVPGVSIIERVDPRIGRSLRSELGLPAWLIAPRLSSRRALRSTPAWRPELVSIEMFT